MATEKQLAANRENAKSSSGPVTPEGKFISPHNAVKTGLTGQTVLLKTDDVEAYKAHINNEHAPARDNERTLVQDLADPNGVCSASSRSKAASGPSAA
jgi:hypothetical protein